MGSKKHKKHKSEKRDRYEEKQLGSVDKPPALKLILKVGSSSTPEHSDSPGPAVSNYSVATTSLIEEGDEEELEKDASIGGRIGLGNTEGSRRILAGGSTMGGLGVAEERHRRAKKKKKKRERDKHEKRHKHHHKEKRKRMRGGSSQEDDVESSMGGSHRRREGEMSLSMLDGSGHRMVPDAGSAIANFVGGTGPSGNLIVGATVGSVNTASSQHLPPPAKRPCLQPSSHGQHGDSVAANQTSAHSEGSSTGVTSQQAQQTNSSTQGNANSTGTSLQNSSATNVGSREPRTCVLRQRQQERAPLQRLLEHLLRALERRDPHHFFAWPVTDSIAPGYSQIIRRPMDFSTMKQKIDEGQYATLGEYVEDFKLMCNNAMVYNHPDTIYYKAAKRLLHVGLRAMTPEKIRPLASVLPSLARLTRRELGFELNLPPPQPPPQPPVTTPAAAQVSAAGEAQTKTEGDEETPMEGVVEGGVTTSNEGEARVTGAEEEEDDFEEGDDGGRRELKRRSARTKPGSKFEAIVDDLTPEEILAQARKAAATAAHKLTLKRAGAKMGFLRQRKDGTTSLAVLIPSDGIAPGTNEKPVSLGALVGKLTHGTGQLQGFREDRRNAAKTVKPLYYGSFGSYAPSYDSTFANLTKEESDLVYSTYGDETAVQYAESILDFAKDCDYALKMVDNLLDIVTGGEHRRTMRILEENRRKARGEGGPDDEGGRYKRYLQEAEKTSSTTQTGMSDSSASKTSGPTQNASAPVDSSTNSSSDPYDVKIDFEALKTLSDVGIDVSFLENVENELKNEALQRGLDQTGELLGKLEQVQRERLSQPPPSHLSLVPKPSEIEVQLAEKITENLTDMAKRVTPEAIVPLPAIRKAMGIAPTGIGVMHSIPTNSTIRVNEDVAVEDDDEEEENQNAHLPGSDSSQNVAKSLAGGSVSSDPKLVGSVKEVVLDSSEKRMLVTSGKDVEDMVSKLHEGVLDEVCVEDSRLEQPIKMDESIQSKEGSDHDISRTLKEEISEDKVQETTSSLNAAVDVGNRESGNILISDIKVESTDQVDLERHNPEKDVLFGKPGELIPKQEMVGQGHMGSECILGGRDDNVLGSIPVLGDAACVELGAILAGSDSKDNLTKVQVEGNSLTDVRAVSGGMVTEGISMVSSGNSSLANNVVVSSHLSASGSSLVRSSNSMMSSRSGSSNGGMSVVVVEAGGVVEEVEVPDLESELREFLENEPALGGSPLQDDKTIEEILSES